MDMPSLSKGKAIEESTGSMTVLTHAVLTNNLKLVKWLCAMGKDDVNAKDELGLTSAHYACQMGYLKALKHLAKFGANLELRTSDGYTPLMLSIIKGKRNCAEYLINECKCDLLTTDNDGLNVFQRCCASGELSMAKWLIENGGFKPYVNIPTSTTYTNTITQPLNVPDLAVSIAATEFYAKKLAAEGTDVDSIDFLSHELEPAIANLVDYIQQEDVPIPQIKANIPTTSTLYLQPPPPANAGPQIMGLTLPPPPASPRAGRRSSSLNRLSRLLQTEKPQDDGPNPNAPDDEDNKRYDLILPICRSQLIALRAIAERSSQFSVSDHMSYLKSQTIFTKPLSSAAQMHIAMAKAGLAPVTGQNQSAYKNWEEDLPLYEQPDPGSLFLLHRAYNLRNHVLDPGFYDKTWVHFGGDANDTHFVADYLNMKQHFLNEKRQIEETGGQITQIDYPALFALQSKFSLMDNAIHSDLENLQDRPVEFASGSTPLMLAAGYGHKHIVDWLLNSCNVDLHHTNSHGLKAWQVALKSRFIPLFVSLFTESAASLDTLDRYGNTPLLEAIVHKDVQMALFLLALGANPHFVDQNGQTMLMHATINGSVDLVRVLIDSGVDLSVENHNGHDVQTIAVSHSQWSVVKLIEEALEQHALQQIEQELGSLGDADLGLDDASVIPTIDWNSVMQAAQDLELDVVDYCNRLNIDIKLLDKSGRNFLHHSAINGRFEHVKVLVEKGNMNIRSKQTKAFRIYAKSTKGLSALEMALHKKWYTIYCYLFLESALFHDTRPMNRIVSKHSETFSDLEASTIHDFACTARETIIRSSNPLILTLRLVWLFNELSELDRIHRQLYLDLGIRFNKYAIKLVESIPHFSLVIWVLEEPDALNNTAMKIASESNNMTFLSHHLVDKAMSSIWFASDDPNSGDIFPISAFIRRPWFKRLLFDLSLVLRVLLFTIFLAYRVEVNDKIGVVEVLSYVFTLCQLLPSMPPSTKRVNAVTKKNTDFGSSTPKQTADRQSDHNVSDYDHTTLAMNPGSDGEGGDHQPASSGAPQHMTVQQRMQEELIKMEQGIVDNPPPPPSALHIPPDTIPKKKTQKKKDTQPLLGGELEMTSTTPSAPAPNVAPSVTGLKTPPSKEQRRGSVSRLNTPSVRRPSISVVQLHGVTGTPHGIAAGNDDNEDNDSGSESSDSIVMAPTPQRKHSNVSSKRGSTEEPSNIGTDINHDHTGAGDAEMSLPDESKLVASAEPPGLLTPQQKIQLNQALQQDQRDLEQLTKLRQQKKDQKELLKQLAGKQSSRWELLVNHLTHDGWALGDLIVAFVTFILLIVRVIPKQTNPDGETARYVIYLTCMSILPMLYYWRLLEIFAHWETSGPQLIMVFKMVDDVLKFAVLFIMPMIIGFWQYFFLAMDPRQPNAEGYEDAKGIIVTLWNTWWNQISYNFSEFDTPRQVLLLAVSIFITFVTSWFLFNMLVGIMAATIDDVMVNAHHEFASLLVKSRWKQDQALLAPPPPFSLLHLLLVNAVSALSTVPCLKNIGPFKYRKDCWCAYCGERWSNEPFSITRPTNGADKRYPPYVLFEYSPQEAGKRLCHNCLRAQRVLGWYHKMSEWIAELIIRCLIFIPLALYIVFIYPFQKCASAYQAIKVQREYAKGSRKLTSLFATTPYEYSYFGLDKLPDLTFKFEKIHKARQAQLASVSADSVSQSDDEKS